MALEVVLEEPAELKPDAIAQARLDYARQQFLRERMREKEYRPHGSLLRRLLDYRPRYR